MKSLRILLADDHEMVRNGLKAVLIARRGWEVCGEALTGREAVAKARELRPDIAILDITMPELGGLEATRQIRLALPGTEVLILTMHDSDQLVREVLAAGARGYVLKSDAGHALVSAVEALAAHKPFFSSKVSSVVLEGFLHPHKPADTATGSPLTPREREIVQALTEGRINKEVAEVLGISVKTVETHRTNIMRKLGLHSMSELVRYAVRNRIIEA